MSNGMHSCRKSRLPGGRKCTRFCRDATKCRPQLDADSTTVVREFDACWRCNGNHPARECPKKQAIAMPKDLKK